MEPLPGEPQEAEGVLNPATARSRDGELYLFPRLVARGNYSRIGRARLLFDADGKPSGVERLGIVLEPDEAWEQNTVTAGSDILSGFENVTGSEFNDTLTGTGTANVLSGETATAQLQVEP